MRKNIMLFLFLTIIPYGLCLIFSLFCEEVRIGQGDKEVENHLMNKNVLIEINGLYKSMDVEEYLLGVLPGTIPADYDEETLKVQAILIRTNVLKEMEEKGSNDVADLSYDYLTVEERMAFFGKRNFKKYEKRFERAIVDTSGMVLRQEGTLIMALYHEVSIGKTISAKELLGEDVSYLQSVESNQDVEAKHYMNIVCYTWEELQALLSKMQGKEEEVHNSVSPEEATGTGTENQEGAAEKSTEAAVKNATIKVEESTENGYVMKVSVDGTIYTGEELMQGLQLTSTNFYVEEMEDGLRFVCLGKGSGMGVSQYGANRMALEGKNAEEIIRYYLKKVSLEKY